MLRVFEIRVLKKLFGPMGKKLTGGSRKFHNEKLHGLYSSPNVIRKDEIRGHVARTEIKTNAYEVLVGKTEGKRPSRRPRCR
jgi:hypothetical protein